jgi:hypothetical protein
MDKKENNNIDPPLSIEEWILDSIFVHGLQNIPNPSFFPIFLLGTIIGFLVFFYF